MTIELTNEITNPKQVQVNQSTTEHSISSMFIQQLVISFLKFSSHISNLKRERRS
jgi:hypothetical protein